MLKEINTYNDLSRYAKWTKAYQETTMATEDKEKKQYREYISERTKWLIDRRDEEEENGNTEEATLLTTK